MKGLQAFVGLSGLFLGTQLWAALPAVDLQEILQMPEGNRRILAQKKADLYYPELVKLAFSDEQPMSVRWKSLILAAQLGHQKSVPDLVKASQHSLWFMRNAALTALNEIDPDQAFTAAKKLLKDKALVVRSAAVDILGTSSHPEARDLLWEALHASQNYKNKTSLWIRPQIMRYLSRSPKAHERPQFMSLLKEPDVKIQKISSAALDKISK